MKTIVINTSNEAKNTKLDVLFKAPFDSNSLLWIDSRLSTIGENVQIIKQNLLKADTVDKDYQMIVLVDLYAFPMGNDKKTAEVYQMLVERYICSLLAEPLYKDCNLVPQGLSVLFVDSSKNIRGLDVHALMDNIVVQEEQEKQAALQREKQMQRSISGENLVDDVPDKKKPARLKTETEQILMNLFGWTEEMKSNAFSWLLKANAAGDECLDFTDVFSVTSSSIAKSHVSAQVLDIALQGVLAPREQWQLSSIGRFPVYTPVCFVSRENEQSKLEGFFCVFVNIFTSVQEKTLFSQVVQLDKEQICKLLADALKKYKYFSNEDNIKVEFEPIVKVFKLKDTIFEKRKKEAKGRNDFKDKTAEEVAEQVMSEFKAPRRVPKDEKLRGLDSKFYDMTEQIFGNYDESVIQKQNNRIVQSCLDGLWSWRDKQTRESFRAVVDSVVANSGNLTNASETVEAQRETTAFLKEEYETKRDELINQVTDAENKLAGNNNILLETKDLALRYGDWMRKGKWSWISFLGAVFTVIATIFPFFYLEYCVGNTGFGFHVTLLAVTGICAFLYAVASGIYCGYINRKKVALIHDLGTLWEKSETERKQSIAALYRYYSDIIVEAESLSLLWREIERRDRENAKKGIKRNYHIKRLKNLTQQVERFITMMKLDVSGKLTVTADDEKKYAQMGLLINGEESFYQQENARVYYLLPEKDADILQKGDTEAT